MGKYKLSPTMAAALQMITDGGGTLVRREGGFWTPSGRPYVSGDPYVNTNTVSALQTRGLLNVNWRGQASAALATAPTQSPGTAAPADDRLDSPADPNTPS